MTRCTGKSTRRPAPDLADPAAATVSFSKSISVLHASRRENERRAHLAADRQAAAYGAGHEEAFLEVLCRVHPGRAGYAQAWVGVTRTGYHGIWVDLTCRLRNLCNPSCCTV
jgi:hypothetical protein